MRRNLIVAAAAILCMHAVNSDLFAQDWSQWMGTNRNGKVAGFTAPSTWPAELKTEWKIKIGTGDASPVLKGNHLFTFTRESDEEVIRCIDAVTGREIWKNSYQAIPVTGPAQSHPGPRSTPVVAGNKLITFGVGGTLSCFDAAGGKLLWKKEYPGLGFPQFFTGMSPLVDGNKCIIHLGSKDNGELVALDIENGNLIWKWTGEGPAYGSPVLMTADGSKMVVLLTEKSLVGISISDGKLLWQEPTTIVNRFYNAASPVIAGNNIYFTGQGQGTRALTVTSQGGSFVAREQWVNPTAGTKWTTPILKDGFIYALSDQRKLFCLNAKTGTTEWIDETSNHDFGTVVDAGNVMVALPASANLIFYQPDHQKYSELARYKVSETPVFTFPIISGKRIFIKDAEHLVSFRLE